MDIRENVDVLFERLKEFIKTETVVGQAIHIDDTIIVPFVTVTFGAGIGGSMSNGNKNDGSDGSGGGAGARITPDAVLVIKGERISLLPIKQVNSMEKLMEMVPNILSKITKKKDSKQSEVTDVNGETIKKRDLK